MKLTDMVENIKLKEKRARRKAIAYRILSYVCAFGVGFALYDEIINDRNLIVGSFIVSFGATGGIFSTLLSVKNEFESRYLRENYPAYFRD
ncbi:MAG: hypothetical protein ABIH49_00985 [archaeon]